MSANGQAQRLRASQRQQRTTHEQAIRHAGRAHIRGKIRRVWRPRYMEVLDSGLVRYYELPPTADVALPEDSDWAHVNMIPKDTLYILNARIIDVTTLRDLHVGLPRGSFGFLFRGQRQQVVSSPEMLATCGPPEPVMPRDFFCAVSTLVEAQTWVIALQWAAGMCQARPSLSRASSDSCHGPSASFAVPSHPSGAATLRPPSHSSREQRRNRSQSQQSIATSVESSPTTAGDRTVGSDMAESNSIDDLSHISKTELDDDDTVQRPAVVKTIIVTKVQTFHLVRLRATDFEVAFEIQLLLLQLEQGKLISLSERRVVRTMHDLEAMMKRLTLDVERKAPSKVAVVKKLQKRLTTVPRIISGRSQQVTSLLTMTTMKIRTLKDFQRCVPTIDGILRSISMDPIIVNSQSIKSCLALTDIPAGLSSQDVSEKLSWLKLHDPQSIVYSRTTSTQLPKTSTDVYVKGWLAKGQDAKPSVTRLQLLLVQMQSLIATVLVALLIPSTRPLWNLYQCLFARSMPTRADLLLLSWAIAYYAGQKRSTAKNAASTATKHKSLRRPTLQIPPVSSSLPKQTDVQLAGQNNQVCQETIAQHAVADEIEDASDDSVDIDNADDADTIDGEIHDDDIDSDEAHGDAGRLSSPLPFYPANDGASCWSRPEDNIFRVRGCTYLDDRIKIPSGPSPFTCRGVDVWLTDNPPRHIARHPSVLGGKLGEADTFLVNFLLPFGNLVSYFSIPPLEQFPEKLRDVWQKFLKGDQQYRDARLKLLPVVVDGPWIVRAAVGNGTAPALLGKVIPLQYFFRDPDEKRKGVYEVDVIITASSIAKGILSVVKGHTKSLSIAFAFIIEAAEKEELPETVLCSFQVHALHLEDCPHLPNRDLDATGE